MDPQQRAQRVLALGDGIATRREFSAAKVDSRWLRRQLQKGALQEPFPGVIRVAVDTGSPQARLMAALRYAGPDAVASHQTAAWLWGLSAAPSAHDAIHVSLPHGQRRRSAPGVVVHQRTGHREVTTLREIPVTDVPATIVGVAQTKGLDGARSAAAEAVRQGLMHRDWLSRVSGVPRRLLKIIRWVAQELAAGVLSGTEGRFWRGVHRSWLPLPEVNAELETEIGRRWIDSLWRGLRAGVEIDGRTFHAQVAAFRSDRERQNAIQSQGIVLLRFAAEDVYTRLDDVVEQVGRFLESRAAELGTRLSRRRRRRRRN